MTRLLRRAMGMCSRIGAAVTEELFRLRFGPETGGYSFLEEQQLASDERVWYVPTEWLGLRRAFRRLRPTASDVLVDVGAGRGRALLVAGMCPFSRVIGVELSDGMVEVARQALARNCGRLVCKNVDVVSSDALTYVFPDDVTVVYMYCPFVGETFAAFMERLFAFADRHAHRVRLLYNYPVEHATLLRTGRVVVVDVCSSSWPSRPLDGPEVIITYEILRTNELPTIVPRQVKLPKRGRCWLAQYDPGFVVWRDGRVWFSSAAWRQREAGGA